MVKETKTKIPSDLTNLSFICPGVSKSTTSGLYSSFFTVNEFFWSHGVIPRWKIKKRAQPVKTFKMYKDGQQNANCNYERAGAGRIKFYVKSLEG
jgi:hypothetical protein